MSDQSSKVPQTNALSHLLSILTGQGGASGAASGPVDQFGVPGGAAVNSPSQIPNSGASGYNGALPGMPVMSPQAWMKQGTGNFMPAPGGLSGGKGGATGADDKSGGLGASIMKLFGA